MPLLPYLGKTEDTKWTKAQSISFVILTYAIALAFCAGLCLAIRNLRQFILGYRSNSRCGHPMLFFYLWIVLDFIANIVWAIMAVGANHLQIVFLFFLPGTFKVLIGIE